MFRLPRLRNLAGLFLEQLECRCLLASSTLSIADAQVIEGDASTATMTLAIHRSGDLSTELQVQVETSPGTAAERDDFRPRTQTFVLPPGQETTEVSVRVIGDTASEGDETFFVRMTPAVGPVYRIDAGERPYGLMTGDFNADGRLDLAATRLFPDDLTGMLDSLSMLLNEYSPESDSLHFGQLTELSLVGNEIQFQTTFGAVGDLNDDGRPDLAVPNLGNYTGHEVSVLLNNTAAGASAPSFTQNTNLSVDDAPNSVAIGDLNGDGRPDLVASIIGPETNPGTVVSVFVNETATRAEVPAFRSKQDFTVEDRPWHVALADLNSDGRLDILTANYGTERDSGNGVSVLMNRTTPGSPVLSFAEKIRFETALRPSWVAVDDLNADGKPDIVTANRMGANISVLLNTTMAGSAVPSFAPRIDFHSPGNPTNLVIVDFDGDGKRDIAVLRRDSGDVRVFLNHTENGSETPAFTSWPVARANGRPRSIVAGDFNGDGRVELATASPYDNTIAIFLYPTFEISDGEAIGTIVDDDTHRAGDVNKDGVVDASDIDAFFAAILSGNPESKFDLNKDLRVDRADVDELVGNILGTVYGDANLDGIFNRADLISVLQAGQYEDARVVNSRWATGDWDGDLEFTNFDLILALQKGAYKG